MTSKNSVSYQFDEANRFIIENYNWAKSFANFFPGIAGRWGIPNWCYYVSRNQGLCSLGINDKNHQIMEFLPFNKALSSVGRVGFRTFLKTGDGKIHEPFQKVRNSAIAQRLIVSSGELEIVEENDESGIKTNVLYYPLVDYRTPSIIRELHLKNSGESRIEFEVVDGLPRIIPYGMDIHTIQTTPRHAEGLMQVADHEGIPLFRLKQTPKDVEQVARIEGGNFYLSMTGDARTLLGNGVLVDPAILFGEAENYDYPWNFEDLPLAALIDKKQIRLNRTPCAFTTASLSMEPGETAVIRSVIGYVKKDDELTKLVEDTSDASFFQAKRNENIELLEDIKSYALTVTNSQAFDEYSGQTFLDNVVRGGMPTIFGNEDKKNTFYIYSKQNGDLERDYHFFVVEPTYLSQGTGHYRSILQNRRSDTWFFPEIDDFNIGHYLNLAQLDGYNPLEVKGSTYTATDGDELRSCLTGIVGEDRLNRFMQIVSRPFTPGEFIMALEDEGLKTDRNYQEALDALIPLCEEDDVGGFHDLGFWVDHWCYNLDTIESYLMVYPDRAALLLFENRDYTFFDNPDRVLPRSDKCVLTASGVRRYSAAIHDEEKAALIDSRKRHKNRVRTNYGEGEIYSTSLFVKLLCHVANRMATLDPNNIGVEMEANKPGWNDSMSGLPGIFGSSLCHTFELQRFCKFLKECLSNGIPPLCKGRLGGVPNSTIPIFEELANFTSNLSQAIEKRITSRNTDKRFVYWDESNAIKETYRERTRLGVSGKEKNMSAADICNFLNKSLELLGEVYSPESRNLVFDENGICNTYMRHKVTEYVPIWKDEAREIRKMNAAGQPLVEPLAFAAHPIALFLEGPVHFMRANPERASEMYTPIRHSDLFDKKLKMYKVCESLRDETFEIGRVHAWGSGWIENESVYTHMEYKYLLELLKCGLYDEFYEDIKTGFMCFLKPEIYGRSTSENVSFVVSSAFPDESMHGQGFQARLSGVTNEFVHMWTLMMAGPRPFFVDDEDRLKLKLEPKLPEWLFTTTEKTCRGSNSPIPEDSVAFKFLGRCLVVYNNPRRKNTFGDEAASIKSLRLTFDDGHVATVEGDTLDSSFALDVREGRVKRIDCELS